jgi:hypothetical protein
LQVLKNSGLAIYFWIVSEKSGIIPFSINFGHLKKTHAGEMTAITLQTAAEDALRTVISTMAPSMQQTPGAPQKNSAPLSRHEKKGIIFIEKIVYL